MGARIATDQYVVWLDGQPVSREIAGGKGASLSRLSALGASVPTAFAMTVAAYAKMAEHAGIPSRVSDVGDADLPAIRAALLETPLPASVERELLVAHARLASLGGDALAVRSSSTAEDGAEFSFAGLHDSVLDVRGERHLLAAVRRCWASLWTDRAVAYRRAGGSATNEAAIAVVVQHLVRSDVSFVAFSADPVGGRADHLLINATWGLGEALVSGAVTPDHIVIGPDGRVAEYTVGEKTLMVVPGEHGEGTKEVTVPRMLRQTPVLSAAAAEEIASSARSLAGRLGWPADLEGGISAQHLFLFQARPITSAIRIS